MEAKTNKTLAEVKASKVVVDAQAKANKVVAEAQAKTGLTVSWSPLNANGKAGVASERTAAEEKKVERICELGFSAVAARLALNKSGGDPDAACDWLLQDSNSKEIQALERNDFPEWAQQEKDNIEGSKAATACRADGWRPSSCSVSPEEYLQSESALKDLDDDEDQGRGLGTRRRSWLEAAPSPPVLVNEEDFASSSEEDHEEVQRQVVLEDDLIDDKVLVAEVAVDGKRDEEVVPSPAAENAALTAAEVIEFQLYGTLYRASVVRRRRASEDMNGYGLTHQLLYHTGATGTEWVSLDARKWVLRDAYGHIGVPYKRIKERQVALQGARASLAAGEERPRPQPKEEQDEDEKEPTPAAVALEEVVLEASSSSSSPRALAESVGGPVDKDDECDKESELSEEEPELFLPPPDSDSWDWPLSREEKKSRVRMIERHVEIMDRRTLMQELVELRLRWRKEGKKLQLPRACKKGDKKERRQSEGPDWQCRQVDDDELVHAEDRKVAKVVKDEVVKKEVKGELVKEETASKEKEDENDKLDQVLPEESVLLEDDEVEVVASQLVDEVATAAFTRSGA